MMKKILKDLENLDCEDVLLEDYLISNLQAFLAGAFAWMPPDELP
jgi:hypothetical protein